MIVNNPGDEYVGVDGCRVGWFAVGLASPDSWDLGVYQDFESLWATYSRAKLILIDIPIGLIDSGSDGRLCDSVARRYLGPGRASSVFTPPARPTLNMPDRPKASELNKSLTGRGITVQSWAIAPKIQQLDLFLRSNERAAKITREIHPEILFWALNGGQPMVNRKGRPIGYHERLEVLRRVFDPSDDIAESAVARYRRYEVARDDILDALAAAITGYLSQGELTSIPDPVQRDNFSLPMEMAYYMP